MELELRNRTGINGRCGTVTTHSGLMIAEVAFFLLCCVYVFTICKKYANFRTHFKADRRKKCLWLEEDYIAYILYLEESTDAAFDILTELSC